MRITIKLTSLFVFTIFAFNGHSQLKVDATGRIGMGTNYPNPEFKCHISGNLLLTSYPTTPFYELRMKVNNGWPGVEIGSNHDQIAFWSANVDWNDLYAANYYKMSDVSVKSNIQKIKGLEKLMKINPVIYSIIDNKTDDLGNKIEGKSNQFGFISQEIEKAFPEVKITDDVKGYKLLDYDQIIPITVAAIQDQQLIIDSLRNELAELNQKLDRINVSLGQQENGILGAETHKLYQNSPNPFNQKTTIKYSIKETGFSSASLVIFDMNGTLVKQYSIDKSGENSIEINANELKAGMYIYTLIVNQKEIDSKRMILLN